MNNASQRPTLGVEFRMLTAIASGNQHCCSPSTTVFKRSGTNHIGLKGSSMESHKIATLLPAHPSSEVGRTQMVT